MKNILVIGGAHIDRNGAMNSPYIMGSSIPGTMTEDIGGGAFNVATNLTRLGCSVTFSSPRSSNSLTEMIKERMHQYPSFTDAPVRVEGRLPSYTAIKDQQGELIAALADMELYDQVTSEEFLTEDLLKKIRSAEVLVTDANLPDPVLKDIADSKSSECVWYVIGTSPSKITKYRNLLSKIDLLSMNMNEAKEMTKNNSDDIEDITQELQELGLAGALISDGERPLYYYSSQTDLMSCEPYRVQNLIDVTGAGDASLSGFIAATLAEARPAKAIKYGLAAAKITIEAMGACSDQLSTKNIEAIIANK